MLSLHTQDKIAKLAANLGLYIYDIDMLKEDNRPIFRISITRKAPMQMPKSPNESAITLQDCQTLSELISPLLDVEESNLDSYYLEVSSPGLERTLKTFTHYTYSLGEYVSVKLGDKSIIEGILLNVNEEGIDIQSHQNPIHLPFADIKKAKVIFAL